MHDEYQVNFKQTYANTSCLLSTSFNISQYHAHTSGHNFWDIENMYSNRHRVTHLFSARLCRGRGAVKPNLDHDESNKKRLQKVNSQSWNLIIWWNLMVFLIHVLNQEEEVRRLRIYHRNKLVPQPLEALFGEGDPLLQGCLIVGQPHTPAVAMGVIQNHLESGPVRERHQKTSPCLHRFSSPKFDGVCFMHWLCHHMQKTCTLWDCLIWQQWWHESRNTAAIPMPKGPEEFEGSTSSSIPIASGAGVDVIFCCGSNEQRIL